MKRKERERKEKKNRAYNEFGNLYITLHKIVRANYV